jgi:hypothetical protein
MIRYLQINIHLGLVKVAIPANIMNNNALLINIAMFDILSGDGICKRCELNKYFAMEKNQEIPENLTPAM